jgi:hypothetical protein
MYFDDAAESFDPIESKSMGLILLVTAAITAILFVYLPVITEPAARAAQALIAG